MRTLIIDIQSDVTNGNMGDRVLIASTSFATSPAVTPDFTMTNLIPASYLAAGSLTFEDDFGTIYWRICWGGPAYTGSTAVFPFGNDDNGDVAPPFGAALPSTSLSALVFNGSPATGSTNTAAQYSIPATAAVFTNNTGGSGTVIAPPPSCTGNTNGDTTVNVTDLLNVINAWGPCLTCPTPCAADVAPPGGNCSINVTDLLLVINSWGPCP